MIEECGDRPCWLTPLMPGFGPVARDQAAAKALLWLLHAAIELEARALERLGSVRLALKHDMLHSQFRIAAHGRSELRHRPRQGMVEDRRSLRLQIREPEAYERRDAQRRWIPPDLVARCSYFGQRHNPHRDRCILRRGCEPEAPHLTCQEHDAHERHNHAAIEGYESCTGAESVYGR